MKKENNNEFANFLKKISEFRKSELSNTSFQTNYKFDNNLNKNDKNDFGYSNINNNYSFNKNESFENYKYQNKQKTKNKNKEKIFCYNNTIPPQRNEKEKENLINFMKEYQLKNDEKKNNFYTNPFIQRDTNGKINCNNNQNKQLTHIFQNNPPQACLINEEIEFIRDTDNNEKILEISENNKNKFHNLSSDVSHKDIYKNNNEKRNNKFLELNEPQGKGNKYIKLSIIFLCLYIFILFFVKFEKLRMLLKEIFKKINLEVIKNVLNKLLDYINKLFDEYDDSFRLISIILIIYFLWIILKFLIKLVIDYYKNSDDKENDEDKIEMI